MTLHLLIFYLVTSHTLRVSLSHPGPPTDHWLAPRNTLESGTSILVSFSLNRKCCEEGRKVLEKVEERGQETGVLVTLLSLAPSLMALSVWFRFFCSCSHREKVVGLRNGRRHSMKDSLNESETC